MFSFNNPKFLGNTPEVATVMRSFVIIRVLFLQHFLVKLLFSFGLVQVLREKQLGILVNERVQEDKRPLFSEKSEHVKDKLDISIFEDRVVAGCLHKHLHVLDPLPLEFEEWVDEVAAVYEEVLLGNGLDPYYYFLEVHLLCLDPLAKEGRHGLELVALVLLCGDEVKVVLLVVFLEDQVVPVKGLELVTDHEALEVRVLLVP